MLTSLSKMRQGPALIERLGCEAKSSAQTLNVTEISSEEGVQKILKHLDKSYAVDETDQLDSDLANFFDSTGDQKDCRIVHSGISRKAVKIASLNIDSKLKGRLLLKQACLDNQDRNVIVGAASGKYDVTQISNPLRQAYRRMKRNEANISFERRQKKSVEHVIELEKFATNVVKIENAGKRIDFTMAHTTKAQHYPHSSRTERKKPERIHALLL
eukprot:IDg15089t1